MPSIFHFGKLIPILALFLATSCNMLAQDVLFSVAGEEVETDEFSYVYEKNNMNDKELYALSSLEEYLELYINFKLKVKAAEEAGLYEDPSLRTELKKYRRQLSKSYLTDREVNEELVKEAYERSKKELNVSHILLMFDANMSPRDTLEMYNEMLIIKKEITSRAKTFARAANAYTDDRDPNSKEKVDGNIGYITAFNTIYPFETAAYNAEIGEVVGPIKTIYGYHLILVEDEREAQGKVEVGQILLKVPELADDAMKAKIKAKIDEIHEQLEAGQNFEELARKHSEHKVSAAKGGYLGWYGTGVLTEQFEKEAFELKKAGSISKPFLSDYGWHIAKLINKRGVGEYEDMKGELKRRVENNSRSRVSRSSFIKKLKKDYRFTENMDAYYEVTDVIDLIEFSTGKWDASATKDMNKPVFKIAGKGYPQSLFAKFIQISQNRPEMKKEKSFEKKLRLMFDKFAEEELIKYEDENLENKYEDFRRLMKEYRDGILLFELTNRKVWDKAGKDTIGLEAFFQKNRNNYLFEDRLEAKIYTCETKKQARQLSEQLKTFKQVQSSKKYLRKIKKGKWTGGDEESIVRAINVAEGSTVIKAHKGLFEKGDNKVIDAVDWKDSVSRIVETDDNRYAVVWNKGIRNPEPKALSDCRGYVISDYQNELEKEWIQELRDKYEIKINRDVLKSMAK